MFYSLILGVLFFVFARFLHSKINQKIVHIIIVAVFFMVSLPGVLFAVYYLHLFDDVLWIVELRSINNIEILSSCVGLFVGYMTKVIRKNNVIEKGVVYLLFFFVLAPYVKPVLLPVTGFGTFKNQWNDDVCIQSTGSSCGPSSLATVLKYYGINKTEEEIAKASFTSATSTEIWYLIRYARNLGFKAVIVNKEQIEEVPYPAIIGTTIGTNIGHFVTLFKIEKNIITIGDSLSGKKILTISEFNDQYKFKQFAVYISR